MEIVPNKALSLSLSLSLSHLGPTIGQHPAHGLKKAKNHETFSNGLSSSRLCLGYRYRVLRLV